jgi:hypothetical protein
MTFMPAIAGNLFDAFLYTWLSIIPPAVGSGCNIKIEPVGLSSVRAASPTRSIPSSVRTVNGVRAAGKTVLGRISSGMSAILSSNWIIRRLLFAYAYTFKNI